MKYLASIVFLLASFSLSAQFRMVGTADGAWTTVDDSTYTASITFQSDLTGKGYLATQIADTFRLFTPTEQIYRVSVVADQTFNTATLTVVEYGGTNGSPVGQLLVFNPDGKSSIPQGVFGSTGATAQMQAAVDTYNARLTGVANAADVTTAQLADTSSAIRSELSIGPTNTILRVPEVNDVITATTPAEFISWYTFAPPTMSLTLSPTTTVYEVGTSNSIDLRAVTTNSAGATLSNGTLTRTVPSSNTVSSFGSVAGDTVTISFTPQQGGSGDYNLTAYSFQATQDYSGAESGTATSNTRSISGVYPVFYGMASTDTTTVKGAIYSTLTKSVVAEGDKTYSFTGSGLIYYAFPSSWSDTNLSQILDPNGFDATASFTRTTATVTSTGLTNNYTSVNYVVYYLNTGSTTTSSSNYTFNQ